MFFTSLSTVQQWTVGIYNCLSCAVLQPLDFEVKREHKLILTVENINPLSSKTRNQPLSSATVMVTVENQNEAPYFKENPIRIEVPENEKPGKLLKSNIASDPDHSELRFGQKDS